MALENKVSGDSGAVNWFFQRISGIVLLFLLLIHFWMMHYSGEEKILFNAVVKRLSDPKFKVIDLSFLVLGLYHGLNGVWMVVQDYLKSPAWKITVFSLLSFAGLILVVLGFVAVLPISPDWVAIP